MDVYRNNNGVEAVCYMSGKKDFIDILASATPEELNELIVTKGKHKKKSMCYIIRKEFEKDDKKEVRNTEAGRKHS